MAEPAGVGVSFAAVDRKFDVSRLEKQFLARAFDLVLGVARKTRKVEKEPCAGRPRRPAIEASTRQGAGP